MPYPDKPNRTLDIDTRVAHLERMVLELGRKLTQQTKATAVQTVQTIVSDGGTSGGSGSGSGSGGSSGNATSINGDPIDGEPEDGDILTFEGGEWKVRNWIEGKLGVGTTAAPAALVELGAGQATAGNAPLKMNAGTRLTAAVAGACNFDGSRFEVAPYEWRSISLSSHHKITTTTIANTVTRTLAASGSIAANQIDGQQTFIFTLLGRYSTANGVDTFTLTGEFGGVDVISFTSTAGVVTNAPVWVQFTGTLRSGGGAGELMGAILADVNNASKTRTGTAPTIVDTGLTLNPSIDVQWSAADPGNSFSADQSFLQILN